MSLRKTSAGSVITLNIKSLNSIFLIDWYFSPWTLVRLASVSEVGYFLKALMVPTYTLKSGWRHEVNSRSLHLSVACRKHLCASTLCVVRRKSLNSRLMRKRFLEFYLPIKTSRTRFVHTRIQSTLSTRGSAQFTALLWTSPLAASGSQMDARAKERFRHTHSSNSV